MISPLKTTALAAAVVATTLTAVPPADANPAAAWIIGGVAVALVGGALIWHNNWNNWGPNYTTAPSGYVGTAPLYANGYNYTGAAPIYAPRYASWSPPRSAGWLSYCESRYRTFNPRTGTFIGSDGLRHFCTG
jgi:hypothetical protein